MDEWMLGKKLALANVRAYCDFLRKQLYSA